MNEERLMKQQVINKERQQQIYIYVIRYLMNRSDNNKQLGDNNKQLGDNNKFQILPLMHFIPTISEISHHTLNNQHQHLSFTIGLVIDMSFPLYRQKHNNYIMEIKLIDQTLNNLIHQTPFITKYLILYLIADTKQQLLFNLKIGDFLLLQKFLFTQWNNIALQTKFYSTIETLFHIQTGEIQYTESFSIKKLIGKQTLSIDKEFIGARIAQLKSFLAINFTYLFNPFLGVKIINNYCSLIEPFSMVLKIHKFQYNQFQNLIFLKDSNHNIFYLNNKPFQHLILTQNQWLYLRGIRQITTDKQIIFTQTGNIIALPGLFGQQFQTQSNHQAIYRKTNKITNQKKQSTLLTYITLFQQKVSTVKQLFDLQDNYKASSKKNDIILQNNYLVKGLVIKYKGNIKLYHTQYQMIVHDRFLEEVPTQQKKYLFINKRQIIEDKKLVYIYQGLLYLIDRSIVSKKQALKIKLFTNDPKSVFFHDKQLLKLNQYIGHSDSSQKVAQTLKIINEKLQKLKQLSSFQNLASLVLEPVRSDELIFRLINTKIA